MKKHISINVTYQQNILQNISYKKILYLSTNSLLLEIKMAFEKDYKLEKRWGN